MTTIKGELAKFAQPSDLRPLLETPGPCLSVYMPLSEASREGKDPNAKENELRWRQCLEGLSADRIGHFDPHGRELIASVRDWNSVSPDGQGHSEDACSIAVFRSQEAFQVVALKPHVPESIRLGNVFYVRPLLKSLENDRPFFLLALSQKHTRLLRCTMHAMEEVVLSSSVSVDFEAWMNQTKPDHRDINNAMTRGAQGNASPNALAPKGSDREAKDEYLLHFFKQIDRGVGEALKDSTEPLVLCAVEYELPLYREVNSYKHLLPDSIHGAPNGMNSADMRAGALVALENAYLAKIDDAVAEWNHRVGAAASSYVKEIVTAAHNGRVSTLLISDSQELTGEYDEATNNVRSRPDEEELLNDAAVQTILHSGTVLISPNAKMPNGVPMAAIFRY